MTEDDLSQLDPPNYKPNKHLEKLFSIYKQANKEGFRERQSQRIISNTKRYKVCYGCGSIVSRIVNTCPMCAAYKFDSSVKGITKQAALLASREPKNQIIE